MWWLQHRIGFSFRIFVYRWKHGKNVVIFGADMSSFVHIDNKNKDILILYEGPTQRLQQRPNIPLIFLFLNAITICQFKTKDSEVKDCTMCLGNTSIDFTIII